MPFFSAIIQRMVKEVVVVEATSSSHARELIDDEDEAVMMIAENEEDLEIEPGSLQEATKEEISRYKRRM
jgi:hypothetical protein